MALEDKQIYEELSNRYSILRTEELKKKIEPYLKSLETIPAGLKSEELFQINKNNILAYFKAEPEKWNDWHWQLKHRITDVETLDGIVGLSAVQKKKSPRSAGSIAGLFLLIISAWPISPIRLTPF